MHIIALAWIYIVSMMAITESSVVAGLLTFFLYCALPLALVWYIYSKIYSPKKHKISKKAQGHDNNKSN
jgi:4-hydroxybenzoate polyprenyltransferase